MSVASQTVRIDKMYISSIKDANISIQYDYCGILSSTVFIMQ